MLTDTLFSLSINIFTSIVIIYIIHLLWNYLKDTYSTKKTKDLVNTQIQKYKMMVNEIQQSRPSIPTLRITELEKKEMDAELTSFIQNM